MTKNDKNSNNQKTKSQKTRTQCWSDIAANRVTLEIFFFEQLFVCETI
jgi:hypothetical protein